MTTAIWNPNQAAIAQVETYTFTAPSSIGNTYTATINGKSVTYTSVSGDTAALVATGLFNLLNASTSITPELTEITFANPSAGVVTATAKTPGTPFANITINGVSGQGLVLSTGNGLANGITTANTTANASPSDVNDPQNWLRVDYNTTPPNQTRAIPVNGDDVVINNSDVPLLWNLDRLANVQFQTYRRDQSFTATIGLPENNPNGYVEWRATYFKFSGPIGSVPAGGLQMVLGFEPNNGSGPSRERYDTGSSPVTLVALATGSAQDDYAIRWLGQHTANTFTVHSGVSLGIGMLSNEKAQLSSSSILTGGIVDIGPNVTFTAGSTLTINGGTCVLNAAPATITLNNSNLTIATTDLTFTTITAQNNSTITMLAGGTITTLTLSNGCSLDKSQDARSLTITNSTLDGDSCFIDDPLNSITFTNATSVRQVVSSGPIRFTGTRTVKVT